MKKILFLSLVNVLSSYTFAEDNSSIYRGLGTGTKDFLKFEILKKTRLYSKESNYFKGRL